jgi:hypothetical protein
MLNFEWIRAISLLSAMPWVAFVRDRSFLSTHGSGPWSIVHGPMSTAYLRNASIVCRYASGMPMSKREPSMISP